MIMSAYVVFTRTKTIDQKELEKYRTGIKATMKDNPIEVLVADGKHEVLEGDPIEGMVIVKFPSVKAAKDWCYSTPVQINFVRSEPDARDWQERLGRGSATVEIGFGKNQS